MELAPQLLGVTMTEPGCSRLVSVDVDEAVRMATAERADARAARHPAGRRRAVHRRHRGLRMVARAAHRPAGAGAARGRTTRDASRVARHAVHEFTWFASRAWPCADRCRSSSWRSTSASGTRRALRHLDLGRGRRQHAARERARRRRPPRAPSPTSASGRRDFRSPRVRRAAGARTAAGALLAEGIRASHRHAARGSAQRAALRGPQPAPGFRQRRLLARSARHLSPAG